MENMRTFLNIAEDFQGQLKHRTGGTSFAKCACLCAWKSIVHIRKNTLKNT